jgi:hypothetical protein
MSLKIETRSLCCRDLSVTRHRMMPFYGFFREEQLLPVTPKRVGVDPLCEALLFEARS